MVFARLVSTFGRTNSFVWSVIFDSPSMRSKILATSLRPSLTIRGSSSIKSSFCRGVDFSLDFMLLAEFLEEFIECIFGGGGRKYLVALAHPFCAQLRFYI